MKQRSRRIPPPNMPSGGLGAAFEHRDTPLERLWMSMAVTFAGMLVEIAGGLLTGSVALLSDAGHMFTHLFALGISAVAVRMAREVPCHHRTFGLLRAEVLAAYTNALFLFGVVAWIAWESVGRLFRPQEIMLTEMLAVAAVGLAVNVVSILLLRGHGGNIGVRSAVTHMFADALSSVAIVAGAVVMAVTGWRWIDPLLALGIAAVIFTWAWRLFRDASRILLEVAPSHVNVNDVEAFVRQEFPELTSLERVRIWSITEGVTSFTAEASIGASHSETEAEPLRAELARRLKERFGFTEITIELRSQTVC